MSLRTVFLMALAAIATACTSTPNQDAGKEGDGQKEICRKVKEPGSNIPVRVCRKI